MLQQDEIQSMVSEIIPGQIEKLHVLIVKKGITVTQSIVYEYKLGDVDCTKIGLNCISAFEIMHDKVGSRIAHDVSVWINCDFTVLVHTSNEVNLNQRNDYAKKIGVAMTKTKNEN